MHLWYRLKLGEKLEFIRSLDLRIFMIVLGSSFLVVTLGTILLGWLLIPEANVRSASQSKALPPSNHSQLVVGLRPGQTKKIVERNIFNSEGGVAAPVDTGTVKNMLDDSDIPKSQLPFVLKGVLVAHVPQAGIAMIETSGSSNRKYYEVGENFGSKYKNVTLFEVYESRVILKNDGQKEYLEIEPAKLAKPGRRRSSPASSKKNGLAPLASGPVAESFKEPGFERLNGEVTVTQQYRDNLLNNEMTKVLQDAKAEPNMVGNELKGFRLTRIREGSIYQKAGLQSGDIILEINGIPLRGAAGAIKTLQSVRNESEVEVRLQRGSEFFNLNVSVQ